jgi:hypothetical protein
MFLEDIHIGVFVHKYPQRVTGMRRPAPTGFRPTFSRENFSRPFSTQKFQEIRGVLPA